MTQLSICMPSNRVLKDSIASIESAIAYCRQTDAVLIVSDNSEDPEKREFLQGHSGDLIYVSSVNTSAAENWKRAFAAAETAFIMPMGDDDLIFADPAQPALDLATLGGDYIGAFAVNIAFTQAHGQLARKALSLTADDPAERMKGYLNNAGGNNSNYYSMYRRDVFGGLLSLFLSAHPTQGSYCDWALSLALVASGKMAHDPGTVFHYNMDNWGSREKIDALNTTIYTAVGLPEGSDRYEHLLMFLDLYVMAARKDTPLTEPQKTKLANDIVLMTMGRFVRRVKQTPDDYDETTRYLVELAMAEQNSLGIFQIALMMADILQPGLKDRYVEFFRRAVAA